MSARHARRALLVALSMLALPAWPQPASYPNRPIRLVVFTPPGAGTDLLSRTLAPPLSRALGQPVMVENKPGADGAIAGEFVARSAPDGYTLLMGTNSPLVGAPLLHKNTSYDPLTDFTAIGFVGRFSFYLVVNPEVPARTLAELLDYARANPNRLNYATGNTAGILSIAQVLALGGVKMVHVPYKGEPAAIPDLVAGRIQLMIATASSALELIRAGKLRAIATTNPKRTTQLPDVPTLAESGMPSFSIHAWAALYGPAGLPGDIVDRLNRELNAALMLPEVRRQLDLQEFAYATSTPEEMDAFLKAQFDLWRQAIRDAGIQPD